jgi:hypothetical protein
MRYVALARFLLYVPLLSSCANGPDSACQPIATITVTEAGGCSLDNVAVECGSVGPLLRSKGLHSNCDPHISGSRSTSSAYYQAVGAVLVSLKDAGYKGGVGVRRVLPVPSQ